MDQRCQTLHSGRLGHFCQGVDVKVLIADDHELFRDGLRHVLGQLEGSPIIVEASDFAHALEVVEQEKDIDIVLMDLNMPGIPWMDGLRRLKDAVGPSVPVVVLTASEDRHSVVQAVNVGAAGFIPKTSSSRVMMSALKLVLSGGVYLPPALLDTETLMEVGRRPMPSHTDSTAFLTPRQREVLGLLGQGKSNKEIARVLQLAEGTVKLHVTAILKALKVNNRTRAVVVAAQITGSSSTPEAGPA